MSFLFSQVFLLIFTAPSDIEFKLTVVERIAGDGYVLSMTTIMIAPRIVLTFRD